jgi:hypothetical protein|tara:strand:+ start:1286 stop:1528 length:243 start_codon:yes stop_codon:yes gene_type:complete
MTVRNFQHLMDYADGNGTIEIEEVVAILYLNSNFESRTSDEVIEVRLPTVFKREFIVDYLKNTFIVYMDKFGNGYSRIIF